MFANGRANGGNMQMMMSVGVCCVSAVSVLALGGAALFYMRQPEVVTDIPVDETVVADTTADTTATTTTAGATDIAGRKIIKTGGVSLVVDPRKCSNKKVWFENTKENDSHMWNLIPVKGKDGYFYIQSEQRLFKKACPGYLTAASNCNGGVGIDRPVYADRQYWQAIQTGNGYQLQNVSCLNKRKPSFLVSSGSASGKKNVGRLYSRAGAIYSLESADGTA